MLVAMVSVADPVAAVVVAIAALLILSVKESKRQDQSEVVEAIKIRSEARLNNLAKLEELVKRKGRVTNTEVREMFGCSEALATDYLTELEKRGKIIQVGGEGIGVYYVKNERI